MYHDKKPAISMKTTRQIILAQRPVGLPQLTCFRLVEATLPPLHPGSVLVRMMYLALDPYMRLKLHERPPSYMRPYQIGEPITGYALGQVIASAHAGYQEGMIVTGMLPWQEVALVEGAGLSIVDPAVAPLSTRLGILGMPGLSAYVGLLDLGCPQPGETLFVSSAAGPVGSLVGQLGQRCGCRVVGCAGSAAKVAYLRDELGFDAAFNYRECDDLASVLRQVCPDGIDIDFENVGGTLFEEVLNQMNPGGRVVLCGMIAQYNDDVPGRGPSNLEQAYERHITIRGFNVAQHTDRAPAFLADIGPWLATGHLRYREEFVDGLEQAPRALQRLFTGETFGKLLVRVGAAPA